MKKETIEKLFKRYISIFDNVANQTTGKHLDKSIIDEINSNVDLVFKEYEQIETLNQFNDFSKNILDIIQKTIKKSENLAYEAAFNEFKQRFNFFEKDPFVYIQKEVDNTISKIIPSSEGSYYIPYNPYLDSIMDKGYRVTFSTTKINEHIKNVKAKYDAEREKMIQQNKEEYDKLIDEALKEINKYPIQYCKETFEKYFYDDLLDDLVFYSNNFKNSIITHLIINNLDTSLHTEKYKYSLEFCEDAYEKIKLTFIKGNYKNIYLNDLKNEFLSNLLSRTKIINELFTIYTYVYDNKGLTALQKINLKRKFNIISNNIDNIYDVSFIRVYKFALEHNLYNLNKDFLTNESNRLLAYNILNIILTLLINELKTIKLGNSNFVLNEKYINIINEYYQYIEDNNINEQNRGNVGNPILKISILDSFIDKFNKQFKYKYILEDIKLKFKNIIKNKR